MNAWTLLFWTTAVVVLASGMIVSLLVGHLVIRSPGTTARLYRHHFSDPRRERLFLSSMAFFLTFVAVRGLTYAIRAGLGPFHDFTPGGLHVHHLVWGILLLLAVGYCWLIQVGTGMESPVPWTSGVTAVGYGVAAALTLDEFALWLRLEDVYWSRQGRESIEAVLLFGALLSVGLWGGPFFHGLLRETARVLRR